MTEEFTSALDIDTSFNDLVTFSGEGSIAGYFPYTDYLAASMAAAGVALSHLIEASSGKRHRINVDRDLSHWCLKLCEPFGQQAKFEKSPRIGSVYSTADGRWLRLTDATPRLQSRILSVIGTSPDPEAIAAEIRRHNADELEAAILDAGGAAAASRTMAEWAAHPAGEALAMDPIVAVEHLARTSSDWQPTPGRPLAGIRVLDCTRIVAGPMATRLLAAYGAEVLRLDPPDYHDHASKDQTHYTIGKRCARLDLRLPEGREKFLSLLSGADIFVHGFRPGVFEELGIGPAVREQARPDLVEVVHNAYGWTGPWAKRRGFDTIISVSMGILNESMRRAGIDTPDPEHPGLSQHSILDHCLGHLDAAAALRGLTRRLTERIGSRSRLSLARAAMVLAASGPRPDGPVIGAASAKDPFEDRIVRSARGPAKLRVPPMQIDDTPLFWERPPDAFGSSSPTWSDTGA